MGPLGPGWAASCCFLVVRPQGTQSHAAEPALLITGPQRPELELRQTLPSSRRALATSQQASPHLSLSKAEAQREPPAPARKRWAGDSDPGWQRPPHAHPASPSTLDSAVRALPTPAGLGVRDPGSDPPPGPSLSPHVPVPLLPSPSSPALPQPSSLMGLRELLSPT